MEKRIYKVLEEDEERRDLPGREESLPAEPDEGSRDDVSLSIRDPAALGLPGTGNRPEGAAPEASNTDGTPNSQERSFILGTGGPLEKGSRIRRRGDTLSANGWIIKIVSLPSGLTLDDWITSVKSPDKWFSGQSKQIEDSQTEESSSANVGPENELSRKDAEQ